MSRRLARERAVQALYAWQVSGNNIKDVEYYFISEFDMINVNIAYFCKLCVGVVVNVDLLDTLMLPYLSTGLIKLGLIEQAVLRIALFELSRCLDVPYKVVINEAIELIKIFGSDRSYAFINGILDKIIVDIRYIKK